MLCFVGNFDLKCLSIEFGITNLSQTYLIYQKSLKLIIQISPFEFVFSCCELIKVILWSKICFEILVLKLSGIQNKIIQNLKESVIIWY